MTDKEYQRLKASALQEYQRKLASIETVWKMSREESAPAAPQTRRTRTFQPPAATHEPALFAGANGAVHGSQPRLQYRGNDTKRGTIREAIRSIDPGTQFSLHEVRAALEKIKPELSATLDDNGLSSHLIRLAERNEMEVVTKGASRNPSVYRRNGVL